jgi:hypothetical protein
MGKILKILTGLKLENVNCIFYLMSIEASWDLPEFGGRTEAEFKCK